MTRILLFVFLVAVANGVLLSDGVLIGDGIHAAADQGSGIDPDGRH